MKGIREAAMGLPEEEPTPKYESGKGYKSNLFDHDRYDGAYNTDEYTTGYTPKKYKGYEEPEPIIRGTMSITISIENAEIGKYADFDGPDYDSERATTIATEIAYDYIEKLAGKGFESRYKVDFDVTEGYNDFDANITLTPLTK